MPHGSPSGDETRRCKRAVANSPVSSPVASVGKSVFADLGSDAVVMSPGAKPWFAGQQPFLRDGVLQVMTWLAANAGKRGPTVGLDVIKRVGSVDVLLYQPVTAS
jgi:hypothetical protein